MGEEYAPCQFARSPIRPSPHTPIPKPMTDATIGWLFFVAYLALIGGAALVGIRKTKDFQSFSVGSRQVSPVFVGLALAANLTSAATFVVNPGLMYLYGWAGFLGYAVATPLGIILGLTVLSKSFRKVGDRFTALTVPQWIGDRFEDRRLTLFFAFISLLLITFLVLITVGLSRVLASVLEIEIVVAMVIVIVFPLAYIMLGGASAHTLTNAAQAVIMLVVALMMIGSGMHLFAGGVGAFLERLAAVDPVLALPVNPESLLFRDAFEVFVANFAIGVAVVTQPHIISKALYLKTERDVNTYLFVGFTCAIIFFAVLVTGLYARLLLPGELLAADAVIPTYLVEQFSPVARGLVAIGLLAAGFSTMEGLLVALSAIFANDLYAPLARRRGLAPDLVERRAFRLSKVFLLALAPVLFVISYDQISPDLSVAILAQNGVYGLFSATFVPILFGIFSERITKGAILAAAVTALVVHFGMYYGEIGPYWNNPAVPATFALLASTLVASASLLWTRRKAPAPAV